MPDPVPEPPERLRPLRSLSLMLTTHCNLACAYCYQDARSGRSLPWPLARRALDGLLDAGAPGAVVVFSGGEPLLRLHTIRRAVAHCAREDRGRVGPRFSLFTNGLLLDDRVADFLDEHGFEVQLSFDGAPAAQDRRGPGTHAVLDRVLARLRRRHPRLFEDHLRIAVTVTPDTVALLPESLGRLFALGALDVGAAAATVGCERWDNARLPELDRIFDHIVELCWRHHLDSGETPFLHFAPAKAPPADAAGAWPRCGAAAGQGVAVDVDGTLVSCLVAAPSAQRPTTPMLADHLVHLRLGRLGGSDPGGDLRAAAAKVRKVGLLWGRERMWSGLSACTDCPHLAACVVCPLAAGRRAGENDPDRVPDFICAYNRAAFRAAARFPGRPDPVAVVRHLDPLRRAVRRARER